MNIGFQPSHIVSFVFVFIIRFHEVAYFLSYRYTPYATEQGIILAEQGNLAQEQGILSAKVETIGG